MILKSVLTALIWAACLWAWYVGQLPSWTFLQFRQANCFSSTCLVLWMYPVSPKDENTTLSTILVVTYVRSLSPPPSRSAFPAHYLTLSSRTLARPQSAFWFAVLCLGSYWTLIAPRVLLRRGGHLRDPKKKKVKGFEALRQRVKDDIGDIEHEHEHGHERERGHEDEGESQSGGSSDEDERRRAFIKRNPRAYERDEDGGVSGTFLARCRCNRLDETASLT